MRFFVFSEKYTAKVLLSISLLILLSIMSGCDVGDTVDKLSGSSSSESSSASGSISSTSEQYTFEEWKKECPATTTYNYRVENYDDGSSIEIDECVQGSTKYTLRRLSITPSNETDSDEYDIVILDNGKIVTGTMKYVKYLDYGMSEEAYYILIKGKNNNDRWWNHELSHENWISDNSHNRYDYVPEWSDNDGGSWNFLTTKYTQTHPNKKKMYEIFYFTLQHDNGYWYNPEANGTHWWDNENLYSRWKNQAVDNPNGWDAVRLYYYSYYPDGHPSTVDRDCVTRKEPNGIFFAHCATRQTWNDNPSYMSGVVYSEPWQNADKTWSDIMVERTTWYSNGQKNAQELFSPNDNNGVWEAKLISLRRWASDGTVLEDSTY